MDDLLYPYLVSTVVTAAVLVTAWLSYVRSQKAAIDHQVKSARIPDFLRHVQLTDAVAELERRQDELRQQVAGAEALIQQAAEARQWLSNNATVIQQAKEAQEQMLKVQGELVASREQQAILHEQLRKAQEALAKAEFDRNEQERRTVSLKAEADRLTSEVSSLSSRVDNLEGEKRKLLEEGTSLLTKNAALKAEVAGLEARKATLEHEIATLEERRKTLSSEVLQLEIKERALRITTAPEADAKDAARAEEEIRVPLIAVATLQEAARHETEIKALERVSTDLRSAGLHFSRRVLHAFHTSLKVQGESPLLVLAGISGTGKSLLPQRYAAAMGIHSHLVPVQPRWDGPQDLLGFYHHLEHRFKPTPLTRGLRQFDQFGPNNPEMKDRMLLVVLDEMNLARVEYYFSEFLSRLEARRDINPDSAVDRARASIQLDLGQRGTDAKTFDIFVDRNVLFVGTINEDESTQTISDKVVDRANVIRFARPKRLAANTTSTTQTAPRSEHLASATWLAWMHDAQALSDEHKRIAEGAADRLNGALSKLGRGFGHRTYRAMLSYLQQYPLRHAQRTEADLRLALADQIEQRVFPKLRGLDPSDDLCGHAFTEVQEVVESLGDKELQAAFEAAIENGREGHSFLWQGVERSE